MVKKHKMKLAPEEEFHKEYKVDYGELDEKVKERILELQKENIKILKQIAELEFLAELERENKQKT